MEPSVPVLFLRDAEIYGWRFEPDEEANLWLRVIDGQSAICFGPGSHLTFDGENLRGNAPFTGLDGTIQPNRARIPSEPCWHGDESRRIAPRFAALYRLALDTHAEQRGFRRVVLPYVGFRAAEDTANAVGLSG